MYYLFFTCFLLISFSLNALNHFEIIKVKYFTDQSDRVFIAWTLILLVPGVIFMTLSSIFIKKITIDTIRKTILFKNILTRQTYKYDFSYFDGAIHTFLEHKGAYKTIGLVKDRKVVRYIDSFWVSNYTEMDDALKEIKFLGHYNFGLCRQILLLRRKPIIRPENASS